METSLIQLLKSFDLDELDIDDILDACPGLDIIDTERVAKNISLVIQFGYPKLDLNSLILTNPSFLVYKPEILLKKLNLIQGNVENALKKNPFLI